MKILLIQDFLRSGGTERQSVLLANAFAAAGHATALLTLRPGGSLDATVAPTVKRIVLQRADTRLDWFAPGLLSTAAEFAPDVALCMGRIANCYAGWLQAHLGASSAVIATMRTGKSLPWLFRRSLRRVRQVVANSREAHETLATRYGVSPERIAVIYNSLVFPTSLVRRGSPDSLAGANSDASATGSATGPSRGASTALTTAAARAEAGSPREAIRLRYGAAPGTCVLLCVAMFRPEKNQRELIEIAGALPPHVDWQLWLAGEGPARRACEEFARTKGLTHRVFFPGYVGNPSELYTAADVAVHASRSESLSNFLIEAQARGLPAVAYEAQGIAECFVPGRTGWVIPRNDRTAFRVVIEQLACAALEERSARAAAAREFATLTFDPARQVGAYLDLFQRLRASQPA